MSYFRDIGRALLGRAGAAKASAVGPMIARLYANQPVWSKRDFEKLAREAYQQNAIVNACISKLAAEAALIPIVVYKGKGDKRKEVEDHPILDLLRRPNPELDGVGLLTACLSYYKITGNLFLERTGEDDLARMELYPWRPDRTTVLPGSDGLVAAYEYAVGGARRRIEIDHDSLQRPIMHMKTFNPTDDWYGMSPLDACAWAIDITNEASAWNLGILKNAGAPSGALVYEGNEQGGHAMPEKMYEQLRAEIEDKISGARNAGRPLLLEGGLKWQQMSLNPEQMQYVEGALHAARQIAFTLGVPPMMLGIPGDNTYSNYQEARQAFYQDEVIPLLRRFLGQLTHWFQRQLGEGVYLDLDLDNVDALSLVRQQNWDRVGRSDFLTINEKRLALGYDAVDGGDDVYVGAGLLPLSMSGDIMGGAAEEEPTPDKKPEEKQPPAEKRRGVPPLDRVVHYRSDLP